MKLTTALVALIAVGAWVDGGVFSRVLSTIALGIMAYVEVARRKELAK